MKNIIILVTLCFFLTFLWFYRGLIFATGEDGIPFYNLEKIFSSSLYIWQDIGIGQPTLNILPKITLFAPAYFLSSIGFSIVFIQALMFFFLMTIGIISIYFLLKITFPKDNLIALIGSVFYLLNPYSMSQIWGRSIYQQFFPFALFPLFLLLFILGLKNKNFLYAIAAIFSSVILSTSFSNVSYVLSLWIMVGLYFAYFIFVNRKFKKEIQFSIVYFIFIFVFWILAHSWWLQPFLRIGQSIFESWGQSADYNLNSLKGVSQYFSFTAVIRLLQDYFFFIGKAYGEIYLTYPFVVLSWVIPLILLFSYKAIKKNNNLIFFVVLFGISLFICLGTNPPLGWLFEIIFKNVPYFQVFRNPYEKFGIVFLIAYTVLFSAGFGWLIDKLVVRFKSLKKLKVFVLVSFLVLMNGLYVWPMWTGQFAGGLDSQIWVEVPIYYREADAWLKLQEGDFRVLQAPINPGDSVQYTWPHPFNGIEPSEFLFSKPSLGKNLNFDREIHLGLIKTIKDKEFINKLSDLNIKYIVVHKDINSQFVDTLNIPDTVNALESQKDIKKVRSFGLLDIYQVKIPEGVDHIYSPEVKTSFKKINLTFYEINVKDSSGEFNLYFLESFNSGWNLYYQNERMTNHSKISNYANLWKINKKGTFDLSLKYEPQELIKDGIKVTSFSLLALSLIALFLIKYQKKLRNYFF